MPKLQTNRSTTVTEFLRKPRLTDAVPFALMFLAARSSLLGISPFAVSMFSAAFDLKIGYIGLGAAILGYLSCGAGYEAASYLIAMLLFWLYSRLRENYKSETMLSSVICGALLFVCSFIKYLYTSITVYDFVFTITECITCAFSYVLFKNGAVLLKFSRKAPTEQELISGAVCIGIFISGISGINIYPGIELSRIISAYAVMSVSLNMSLSVAGSCGVAAGLICSMNDVNAIILMGLYGLAAMFGNLLKSFEKYGVALGFLGSCAVTMLYIGNTITVSVIEVIGASVLFVLTPNSFHKAIGSFMSRTVHADMVPADVRMREYLLSRLSSASHAFAKLAGVYRGATEKRLRMYNKDICTIIDNVTERVCISCPDAAVCMGKDRTNSYRIIFQVLETLEKNGFCKPANAPGEFIAMCPKGEIFLCELSHVYELYKKDLIKRGEYINNRELIISQYEEMSDIFSGLYDELGNGFSFLPDLEEKAAERLIKDGYSLREVRILENGIGETEVYIRLNRPADKAELGRKISNILSMPLEYKCTCFGGMFKYSLQAVFEVEYGEKQIAKGSQIISGDSIVSFRTNQNKFFVILCDGMGSGSGAGKESRITVRLLEEFLKDGFSASTAIGIVNSSLAIGNEKECFSSVDLLEIDLITGNAEFYKIGSCKSFLKRGANIETVFSPSLPIGIIPGIHVSCISKKLEDGDLIIMLSDGAEGTGYGYLSSERMKKLISDETNSMNDIAAAIIESSGYRNISKVRDDMSVAAIRVNRII